ncbi:unnamed protein product [Pleuronectes platessa]|uniref:Uncharacterized protein n=1 Tax=Pleuronectes platessa TaxID=8262 RepID=A0A9N7VH31_PLEPL|nr:unnamed protein product [Pleuronectes platessa]
MQMGKTGNELSTFWLEDDPSAMHSRPSSGVIVPGEHEAATVVTIQDGNVRDGKQQPSSVFFGFSCPVTELSFH